ncbi:MAG: FkbM family methyltransferase [Hyphomicrobium sp.]|nr:FkbM family methyltransferase [Hyphomicrobium sp.]
MSFISYAQNLEDLVLWRALQHVRSGFYIDIGAWSPDVDSVTRAFYERGWHGINIEPHPKYLLQLKSSRPNDVNLGIVVSNNEERSTFHMIGDTGLSSLEPAIVQAHCLEGRSIECIDVASMTLESIWTKYILLDQPVHFLKVDVEGHEAAVLMGLDWASHRPWIVVVEATLPNTQIESHAEWEHILFEAQYNLVYCDGLNRFYLAEEKSDLAGTFKYPPNVFDDYLRFGHAKALEERDAALARATRAEANTTYLATRSFYLGLFFLPSGRPRELTRRVLFHGNGKPRRNCRKLILNNEGQPREPFRFWMTSDEYLKLPRAYPRSTNGGEGHQDAPLEERLVSGQVQAQPVVLDGKMMQSFRDWFRAPPTLKNISSQAVTQAQFQEPEYSEWCAAIKEEPRYHRKQWEFVYILQALRAYGAIRPGAKGIGYGVGSEPLPALLAHLGCTILATDLDPERAEIAGWVETNQHAAGSEQLNTRGICDPSVFATRVSFRFLDMNAIPNDITGFDFTWSSCCLEHLGSLQLGLDFIENSLKTLKAGGLAVHTTELNCSSNTETLTQGGTVIYRRRDIRKLAARLTSKGHQVAPLNFNLGDHKLDKYIDVPPYSPDRHLKLRLSQYASTSFGFIVRKAA